MDKRHEPDALSCAPRRSAPDIFVNIFCRGIQRNVGMQLLMNPLPLSGPGHHRRATKTQSKLTRYAAAAIFDAEREQENGSTRSMYRRCRNEILDVPVGYYCVPCREYGWCGSKSRGYDSAVNPQVLPLGVALLE